MEKSCELSEPILCCVLMNGRELCPEQVYKLSRVCELVRVKLSGLYCTSTSKATASSVDEMKQEEKRLHEKLEQLTSEHTAVEEAMQRGIGYVEEGGAKIKNALAKQDMMEVEAGYKLVEFGKDKQSEATSKISRIMDERNKVERELFKLKGAKRSKK